MPDVRDTALRVGMIARPPLPARVLPGREAPQRNRPGFQRGRGADWVYKLVASGRLVAFRIGNRKGLQVTVSSIEAYLASRKVEPE